MIKRFQKDPQSKINEEEKLDLVGKQIEAQQGPFSRIEN